MTTQPEIKLTSVKYNGSFSLETHCYRAMLSLKVGGKWKKLAEVSNTGRGGCDCVDTVEGVTWEQIKELDEEIEETYPRIKSEYFPDGLKRNLEILCHEHLETWLHARDLKRKLKTHILGLTEDGKEIHQWPRKRAGRKELTLANWIMWNTTKKQGYRNLNSMTFDEALRVYRESAV